MLMKRCKELGSGSERQKDYSTQTKRNMDDQVQHQLGADYHQVPLAQAQPLYITNGWQLISTQAKDQEEDSLLKGGDCDCDCEAECECDSPLAPQCQYHDQNYEINLSGQESDRQIGNWKRNENSKNDKNKCKLVLVLVILVILLFAAVLILSLSNLNLGLQLHHWAKSKNASMKTANWNSNLGSRLNNFGNSNTNYTLSTSVNYIDTDKGKSQSNSKLQEDDFQLPAALSRVSNFSYLHDAQNNPKKIKIAANRIKSKKTHEDEWIKQQQKEWNSSSIKISRNNIKDLDFADSAKDLNEFLAYQCNSEKDYGAINTKLNQKKQWQKQSVKPQTQSKKLNYNYKHRVEKLAMVMRHGARTVVKSMESNNPSVMWPAPSFLEAFIDVEDQDLGISHSCDKTGQGVVDMTIPVLQGQVNKADNDRESKVEGDIKSSRRKQPKTSTQQMQKQIFHFDVGYFDRPSGSPTAPSYEVHHTEDAKAQYDYQSQTRQYKQALRGSCGLGQLTNDGCEMEANNGRRIAEAYMYGHGHGGAGAGDFDFNLIQHPNDIYIRTDVDGTLRTQQSWYCFVGGLFEGGAAAVHGPQQKDLELEPEAGRINIKVHLEDEKFTTQLMHFPIGKVFQSVLDRFYSWLSNAKPNSKPEPNPKTTSTKPHYDYYEQKNQKSQWKDSNASQLQAHGDGSLNLKSVAPQSKHFDVYAIKEQIVGFLKTVFSGLTKESLADIGLVLVSDQVELEGVQKQKQNPTRANSHSESNTNIKITKKSFADFYYKFEMWIVNTMCPTVVDGLSYDKNQLYKNTQYLPYLSQGLDQIRDRLRLRNKIKNKSQSQSYHHHVRGVEVEQDQWEWLSLSSLISDDSLWEERKNFYQNWWSTMTRQLLDTTYLNWCYLFPSHMIRPFVHDLLFDLESPKSEANKSSKKLLLYSNHDLTLDPLLGLLQLDIPKWQQASVGFGAYLLFEIGSLEAIESGNKNKIKVVRIIFNGKLRRSLLKILDDNKISLLESNKGVSEEQESVKDQDQEHDHDGKNPLNFVYRWEDLKKVLESF